MQATIRQYIYQHRLLKGLGGCLLDLTKDPEILHKLLCLVKGSLKNTQRSALAILTEQPSSYTTAYNTSSLGLSAELSSPLSQHMSGRVCLSLVCLPLWQQQGNVSALPTAWHHTPRRFPETHCHTLKGPCLRNENPPPKKQQNYRWLCFKKRTCHITLTQGLLKARPVTEVSHCTFEIQTWLLGDLLD